MTQLLSQPHMPTFHIAQLLTPRSYGVLGMESAVCYGNNKEKNENNHRIESLNYLVANKIALESVQKPAICVVSADLYNDIIAVIVSSKG